MALPILYSRMDCVGAFTRFAVQLKRLKFQHKIVHGDLPSELVNLNPKGCFPFLLDKNLALCGDTLMNYLHERYPVPSLLPAEPVPRAQVRMVAAQVIETYALADSGDGHVIPEIEDIQCAFNPEHRYFLNSPVPTLVDVAIIPLLYRAEQLRLFEPVRSPLNHYYHRLVRSPAFQAAMLVNLSGGADDDVAA